jgi:hypothetical protein
MNRGSWYGDGAYPAAAPTGREHNPRRLEDQVTIAERAKALVAVPLEIVVAVR